MNVSASTGGGPISALWCVPPCPLRPLCPGWVCTNVSRLLSTLFPWLLGTGPASVPTRSASARPAGPRWSRPPSSSSEGSLEHGVPCEDRSLGLRGELCTCTTHLSQPNSTLPSHQHPPVFMHGGAPGHRHKAQGLACSCFREHVGPRRRDISIAWPRMPACVRA